MSETREIRLRRLTVRSWRRGTKEMDLILGRFWDAEGAGLEDSELDLYEDFLEENDQDLYQWVSGQGDAPVRFQPLIARLTRV
ncbi:succinate dehydrogenase assembly factor 2 [Silicimonas algicola]|uniref:FAD assembly factor SdhE n=1 Tax=Silicimonas algicola TaxID=1826607 RepID=A0A316GC38_9RHOB|nr:succinate dehydrogenase assembly factor 2 [Silicimonas algicola]AZQ66227.1 succinate dehydrogenase assembly factor 2 [Silicimonas algicola]PWK58539.1 antitoxin CptB [Silicimonas algicola]